MRILLAVDNSRPSANAIQAVATRPWPEGSVIKVISCAPELMPAGLPDAALGAAIYFDKPRQGFLAEAERISNAAVRELTARRLNAHAVVRVGDPVAEILREANEWEADLVVVGTHGYSGFKRLFYGSVAETVVKCAPCSVEVVKRTEAVKVGGSKLRAVPTQEEPQQVPLAA